MKIVTVALSNSGQSGNQRHTIPLLFPNLIHVHVTLALKNSHYHTKYFKRYFDIYAITSMQLLE